MSMIDDNRAPGQDGNANPASEPVASDNLADRVSALENWQGRVTSMLERMGLRVPE